jgi:hypothetical protein
VSRAMEGQLKEYRIKGWGYEGTIKNFSCQCQSYDSLPAPQKALGGCSISRDQIMLPKHFNRKWANMRLEGK